VDSEAALWFNGCWAWPNMAEAGALPSDGYGFLPFVVGDDPSFFMNNKIQASPSKQVMIDKEKATPEQVQAAKGFLDWIVYDEAGQRALVEGCQVIPAAANNEVPVQDPLGADIKAKMDAGATYGPFFNTPGDHWSVLGAAMQKYIAGKSSREELAGAIEEYWAAQGAQEAQAAR
jgi:raffinose/stachyose/melibiose transport system substrate-binding protein